MLRLELNAVARSAIALLLVSTSIQILAKPAVAADDVPRTLDKGLLTPFQGWRGDTSWLASSEVRGRQSLAPQDRVDASSSSQRSVDGSWSLGGATGLERTPTFEVSLGGAATDETYPYLVFEEEFRLESGFDFGVVELAVGGSERWIELTRRTGSGDVGPTAIPLGRYQSKTIRIRFRVESDETVDFDGWTITSPRLVLREPTRDVEVSLLRIGQENFPFVYLDVDVNDGLATIPDLTVADFRVFEDGIEQTEDFRVSPPGSADGVRVADIVFVLDVSGSMGDEIEAVQANMRRFVDALRGSAVDYRVGFVVYADRYFVYNDGNLYGDATQIEAVVDAIELGENGVGDGASPGENRYVSTLLRHPA